MQLVIRDDNNLMRASSVELNQTGHGAFFYFPEFQFVLTTQVLYHIAEKKADRTGEIKRILPALPILKQIIAEEIVEAIFNDIFYHVMAPVIYQQCREGSQVSVGVGFVV